MAADASRLFFALWPEEPARATLAGLALEVAREAHGRPMPAANLHLTVVFVGSVERPRLDALQEIARTAAMTAEAFDVRLDRIGSTSSGVAWITSGTDPPATLLELNARIRQGLRAAAFQVEARAFRPHVTLARNCARRLHRAAAAPVAWRAGSLSLVESQPRRGGSIYRDVAAWPFRGPS